MRNRCVAAAVGAALTLSVLGGAAPAVAATEFGDPCPAINGVPTPYGVFALTAAGDPLPLAAPVGGVLTKWKIEVAAPGPPKAAPITLKTLRVTGPKSVLITGEASGSIVAGTNVFDARIPIQAGDHLGLFGSELTPICTTADENKVAIFDPATSPGSSSEYGEGDAELRFPVTGTIEPDADADGFGDATQDACPQSGAFQACPLVTLAATRKVRKGSVSITVTADAAAPVTVSGVVGLGKGKRARISGGTKSLTPGAPTNFTLKLPKRVKTKLAGLSKKRALTLKVDVAGTNVVGEVTTKTLKVKLRGRAKA